jgi:hypothetical protein
VDPRRDHGAACPNHRRIFLEDQRLSSGIQIARQASTRPGNCLKHRELHITQLGLVRCRLRGVWYTKCIGTFVEFLATEWMRTYPRRKLCCPLAAERCRTCNARGRLYFKTLTETHGYPFTGKAVGQTQPIEQCCWVRKRTNKEGWPHVVWFSSHIGRSGRTSHTE